MQANDDAWQPLKDLAVEVQVHPKTLIKWARDGLRGKKLQHRRRGARYETTRALLNQFFSTDENDGMESPSTASKVTQPTTSKRRRMNAAKSARQVLGID